MTYKLGSLFDGSGGFPLAGFLCDIEPVWAAEIEPYPIAVTRTRFPMMKHYGDISKINGAEIEPVDIISFGSPCQDLSVAGKRAGLKHEDNGDEETTRSGLFMEAVRIIKEMRRATNGKYPTFALWENVPGAFSSNKGEDFRIVLEELIKIVEPGASMPSVPKKGWPYSDSYIGDGWSLAYRVFDAQYWGVPQRRRRIYLVLDLGGERARKVLFEREGLRGYFAEGRTPWEGTPTPAERSLGAAGYEGEHGYVSVLNPWDSQGNQVHDGTSNNIYPVLRGCGGAGYQQGYVLAEAANCEGEPVAYGFPLGFRAENTKCYEDAATTLCNGTRPGFTTGVIQPIAVATQQGGAEITENGICPTITAAAGMSGNNQPWICKPIADECILDDQGDHIYNGVAGTLCANAGDNQLSVCYSIENHPADSRVDIDESGKVQTLTGRMGTGGGNVPMVMEAVIFDGANVTSPINASNPQPGDPCHTLSTDSRNLVVACIDGDKIGKAERAGGSGLGIRSGDKMYTLTAKDVHGVCVPINDKATRYRGGGESRKEDGSGNGFGVGQDGDPSPTLTAGDRHAVGYVETPIALDRAYFNQGQNALYEPQCYEDGTVPTLVARGPSAVAYWDGSQVCGTLTANNAGGSQRMPDKDNFNCVIQGKYRYIVRRLTPTECARLQGFADRWGDIDEKKFFTNDEYEFWLNVRNTHAEINGKAVKDYTKEQMLAWYKRLQSDSAEYKMWGNGISLPTALYCMQGISGALRGTYYETRRTQRN